MNGTIITIIFIYLKILLECFVVMNAIISYNYLLLHLKRNSTATIVLQNSFEKNSIFAKYLIYNSCITKIQ
jgi:hypothetical protein